VFLAPIAAFLLSGGAGSARAVTNPGCPSLVATNVTLTMDITCTYSSWITIVADNITVDLSGHIVTCSGTGYQGSCQTDFSSVGINTNGHKNIRIINSNEEEHGVIKGFYEGVLVNGGSNVKIKGITVTGPHKLAVANDRNAFGIYVSGVQCGTSVDETDDNNLFVKISNNTVSNQLIGIFLFGSSCVKLQDNTVFNNNSDINDGIGIALAFGSSHNKLVDNKVFGNGENLTFFDGGIVVNGTGSDHNLIATNEVSDNNGDGIQLSDGATANLVVDNEMLFNGDPVSGTTFFDAAARTSSTPGSSGGINNTWTDNECLTATSPEPGPGTCNEDKDTIKHLQQETSIMPFPKP